MNRGKAGTGGHRNRGSVDTVGQRNRGGADTGGKRSICGACTGGWSNRWSRHRWATIQVCIMQGNNYFL